jgi:hypothetical protein
MPRGPEEVPGASAQRQTNSSLFNVKRYELWDPKLVANDFVVASTGEWPRRRFLVGFVDKIHRHVVATGCGLRTVPLDDDPPLDDKEEKGRRIVILSEALVAPDVLMVVRQHHHLLIRQHHHLLGHGKRRGPNRRPPPFCG